MFTNKPSLFGNNLQKSNNGLFTTQEQNEDDPYDEDYNPQNVVESESDEGEENNEPDEPEEFNGKLSVF
jgi:hypothetical protein